MTPPAEIARGLSAAQKRALLWLPADGSFGNPLDDSLSEEDDRELDYLEAEGLCAFAEGAYGAAISPLGTAVRAALQKESGK